MALTISGASVTEACGLRAEVRVFIGVGLLADGIFPPLLGFVVLLESAGVKVTEAATLVIEVEPAGFVGVAVVSGLVATGVRVGKT